MLSRVSADGSVSLVTRTGLVNPVGVAVDDEGFVFVANCGNRSLQVIAPDGEARPDQ